MIVMEYNAIPHTSNECAMEYNGNLNNGIQCVLSIEMTTMVCNEHLSHTMNVQ
jgi:hypothetical protein